MTLLTNIPIAIYLAAILILAGISDIQFQKIPNLLTFPTMGIGLFYYTLSQGGIGSRL